MKKESVHAQEGARDIYAGRGLENTFPQLKPYLFQGARVLDVGCGPGTITIDVAQVVHPGEVFGIDPAEASIAQANQIKSERQIQNVTFQTGDARALSFEDHGFDVVYAHAVLGWVPESIRVLSEMRRVTRKEGLVVVTIPEEGVLMMYPPCPAYDRVRAIRHKYWTDPEDSGFYYDGQLGRRALGLLKEVGLEIVCIENMRPSGLHFADGEPFQVQYDLWWLDYKGLAATAYNGLFSLGVLDEETVLEAQNEVKNWANHPYASRLPRLDLVAVGKA